MLGLARVAGALSRGMVTVVGGLRITEPMGRGLPCRGLAGGLSRDLDGSGGGGSGDEAARGGGILTNAGLIALEPADVCVGTRILSRPRALGSILKPLTSPNPDGWCRYGYPTGSGGGGTVSAGGSTPNR